MNISLVSFSFNVKYALFSYISSLFNSDLLVIVFNSDLLVIRFIHQQITVQLSGKLHLSSKYASYENCSSSECYAEFPRDKSTNRNNTS